MIVYDFYNIHSEMSNKNFTEIIQNYQNYNFFFLNWNLP